MGAVAVVPTIIEWLHSHENLQVHVTDLCKDTRLSRSQVLNALHRLRTRNNLNIETVVRGEVFIYHTSPIKMEIPVQRRVFEELGTAKDGRLVIQDVDGKLYEAREL